MFTSSIGNIKPIKWCQIGPETIGIIGDGKYRLCKITEECAYFGRPTGRWIIRFSFQNENGKPFGGYCNSLEDAKNSARKFLELFVEILTTGATNENQSRGFTRY